jgi:hypothetical protein
VVPWICCLNYVFQKLPPPLSRPLSHKGREEQSKVKTWIGLAWRFLGFVA